MDVGTIGNYARENQKEFHWIFALRGLLFDSSLDLSSIVESFTPINQTPQGETETVIFNALSALLRANFGEIVGEEDEDEWDDEDFFALFGRD